MCSSGGIGMCLFPMRYCRLNFSHWNPMAMCLTRARHQCVGIDFSFFNTNQKFPFANRPYSLVAVKETALHKIPIGGHDYILRNNNHLHPCIVTGQGHLAVVFDLPSLWSSDDGTIVEYLRAWEQQALPYNPATNIKNKFRAGILTFCKHKPRRIAKSMVFLYHCGICSLKVFNPWLTLSVRNAV